MEALTAKQLKQMLDTVPDDAVISICGDVVNGVSTLTGKIGNGHLNPYFMAGKGKVVAVVFTRYVEMSTGEVYNSFI